MTDNVRQALDEIVELVKADKAEDALARCERALADNADDVNLVAIKGAVLFKLKAFDEAEECLTRAVDLEPAFLKPREDLGALYLAQKDPARAASHLKKAVAIDPENTSAVLQLATALEQSGREDEAETTISDFTERLPVDRLLAEAEALCRGGRIDEAERLCDAVLRREPENTAALKILAMAANEQERFVIAEAFLTRIARLSPGEALPLVDLASFLNERSRYPEAIEHLKAAAQADPSSAEIHLMLGNLYSIVGKPAEALVAYDRCLAIDAGNPSALVGRGHLLRIEGEQDDAMAAYRQALEERPDFGAAWWYLSSLRRYAADDADVATMKAQLEKTDLSADAQVGLHFALARASEKHEDYESAWRHYVSGNEQKRSLVSYDPVKSELDQQKIRDTYDSNLVTRTGKATSDAVPIFIVGMPRSGSTLIEQILASHSQVEGTGELPYIVMMTANMTTSAPGTLHYTELVGGLPADELTRLGNQYLASAASYRKQGAPFFTDKMPANYPHVGFIRQILPNAKIIDARRDPMATCVANYRQLFAQGKNQSYDLEELGDYYVDYVKTMAHWDDVMPGVVLRVQYEEVVDDLEAQVRRLLDHCDLPFEQGCLEFHKSARPVNTASAEQVREPIYRSGLEFWRHYESHLDELRTALAPVL